MTRLTQAQLKAEREARDAFFYQASQQPTRESNQADKLIDRNLTAWWR